jgi:hypothetical protein
LSGSEATTPGTIPVAEYVRTEHIPISHLAHNWELHSAVALTPAEERTVLREPAHAVPEALAQRLGKLRVLVVPFVACSENGDVVCFSKPSGETHSAVWVETGDCTHLVLPCRELDAHDTGFEFLASIAELLRPRLKASELATYTRILEEELRADVRGEIDEEAATAKQPLLRNRHLRARSLEQFERYRDVSFVSTLAEYLHGLWHDVQVRLGPEHLPVAQLRRRMDVLADMFPPNPGYRVFAEDLGDS